MRRPSAKRWLLVGAAAVLGVSCFQTGPLDGLFRCIDANDCGVAGYVCERGLCCHYDRAPLCPSIASGQTCADGGAGTLYYVDQDQDGYGDSTRPRVYGCSPALGLSLVAGDCNDHDPTVHPGAPELCDGVDHDCDGIVGNNVVDAGSKCPVPGKLGACGVGSATCVNGSTGWSMVCQQISFPTREVCDGVDNDCNGVIDDRPACGGPTDLLSGPAVKSGVLHLAPQLTQLTPPAGGTCVKEWIAPYAWECGSWCRYQGNQDACGAGCGTFCTAPACDVNCQAGCENDSFAAGVWSGQRSEAHALYFEATDGGWDLRNATLTLNLTHQEQNFAYPGWTPNPPGWTAEAQPVVVLCGAGGPFLGFRPDTQKLNGGSGSASLVLSIDGGSGWSRYAPASAAAQLDLSNVRWIEVLINPVEPGIDCVSTFQVSLQGAGFR